MKATATTSTAAPNKYKPSRAQPGDASPRLIPPTQPQPLLHRPQSSQLLLRGIGPGGNGGHARSTQSSPGDTGRSTSYPSASSPQFRRLARTSSMPSARSYAGMRRARRESNASGNNEDGSSDSPRAFRPLIRTYSNPFLQKPLSLAMSSESLPLILGQQHSASGQNLSISSRASTPVQQLHPPPVSAHVERHLTLLDLIAVGVGGTLGTGIFVLCSLLTSTYAGPSSVFCWCLSAVPAVMSGLCFAELAGQIPAAGSTYAYVYASMGELPAVVAAGCLSLEYLVSASAVARGWGDKVVDWIATAPGVNEHKGWMIRLLRPGWNFNPMAFLISAATAMLLLGGVKESKVVTNYFTAFKVAFIVALTLTGFGLLDVRNLTPFVPSEFGARGILQGATSSFFGFLGYDEVCCLTAEAIEPQRNMPRAILWTITVLTVSYMAATLALSGMLPYTEISAVGGFPAAFEARDVEWASTMAALGEMATLPLVVLVAVMAQPRLQFALASDGLMPAWFGQVDERGNMRNGTLFAGLLMTLVASFVPFEYLNDMISAGVLVAFSMTNSSLILLRHESPDDVPFLLERLLTSFNGLCFLSSVLLTHFCKSIVGKSLTGLCCLLALLTCSFIKLWCPAAAYFGGKTRRTTTQHTTVGVVSVLEEEFRTPFLPFVPCLGIFVNWYLVAQLPWSGLALLTLFLSCAIIFYFSFGYYFSVGNNGGWDAYEWDGDDGYMIGVVSVAENDAVVDGSTDNDSAQGLPIEKEIALSPVHDQERS